MFEGSVLCKMVFMFKVAVTFIASWQCSHQMSLTEVIPIAGPSVERSAFAILVICSAPRSHEIRIIALLLLN